jgi:hypothetical protein
VAEKYDPAVNWATHVDMKSGRRRSCRSTARRRTDRTSTPRASARRRWARRTSSRRVQPEDQAVLRADQPRLHGLRAVQGRVRGRPAVRRRDAVDVSAARRARTWATSSPGTRQRQDRQVQAREVLGLERRVDDRRRTSCSTARWKATSRRRR